MWLGEEPVDMPQLKGLLAPCPADEMRISKPEDIVEAYLYLVKTCFSTGETIVAS